MDATCRELLRAWRRDPSDALAADACAAALHRARVELPWELIPALTRWRRQLRLVSRFAAAPPTETDGWPETELVAAEARLGLRLPAAVREWYRVAGRWGGAPALRERTVPPAQLALEDSLLVLQRTSTGTLGVRETDLGAADPPLLVLERSAAPARRLGQRTARTFGGSVVHEIAWVEPCPAGITRTRLAEGLRSRTRGWAWSADYERLGFRGVPLGESIVREGRGCPVHVDEQEEVLLIVLNPGHVELVCRGPEARARAEAKLAELRLPER